METKKEKNSVFPAGFEHVEERLNETVNRLEQLNEQIKARPKERGPSIEYRHPKHVGRILPAQQDKERIALQEEQHKIRLDALTQTEAATQNVDGKYGRIVRDAVREKLFPNPYRTLSREERLIDRNLSKEIEQSQDYMDAMLQPKQTVEKEVADKSEAINKDNLSMSARFSLSLSYTKVTQREIGRDRDKDINKDRD